MHAHTHSTRFLALATSAVFVCAQLLCRACYGSCDGLLSVEASLPWAMCQGRCNQDQHGRQSTGTLFQTKKIKQMIREKCCDRKLYYLDFFTTCMPCEPAVLNVLEADHSFGRFRDREVSMKRVQKTRVWIVWSIRKDRSIWNAALETKESFSVSEIIKVKVREKCLFLSLQNSNCTSYIFAGSQLLVRQLHPKSGIFC